ncbi:protein FAM83E [Fundulus heteroclitus]|uniref:protein FAM83E n=1 Tax=Fundulus heteroclitus TaxID=8078 RepID=UPI00165C50D9|nr:protein FAM83E [Fundulus heteroclitus]
MSNSQEQSLNENVVFLPVDESFPDFLHSEREREAVERLLSSGPEAFYCSVGSELPGCFLSPEEVRQIDGWAENFCSKEPLVEEQNGYESRSDSKNFSSTYDPYHWDTPIPDLELGWPERSPWVMQSSVRVHSSSAPQGDGRVREIIRRHLQMARTLIAIATDQLTDNTIISDLHNAASRGVPVYIILNHRSLQENFTLVKLRHPNIRVRVVGGKTFCSRTGRMVVGDLKSNFILVDLDVVIHGSYRLTWTDAHLHRQLITVLRGSAVHSFDEEFRLLFAESVPVTEALVVPAGPQIYQPQQAEDFSRPKLQKLLSAELELTNPPSPPTDILLDWEAMGVIHRDNNNLPSTLLDLNKENVAEKMSQLETNKDTPPVDSLTYKQHLVNRRSSMGVLSTNPPAAERMERPEHTIERREFPAEKPPKRQQTTVTRIDVPPEPTNVAYTRRRSTPWMETCLEEKQRTNHVNAFEDTPSAMRKTSLIPRVTPSKNFTSASEIMKKLKLGTGLRRNSTLSESMSMSQSMMDLSQQNHRDREYPVPRFLGGDAMTPASVLIRNRNDEGKSSLQRSTSTLMLNERPRSNTLNSIYASKRWPKNNNLS